jgi:hypothetical protein
MPAFGCARTITIGKDPEPAAAEEKPVQPKRYRVSLPENHGIYTPMMLDLMKALNEGVGYEMLILPAPLYEATTEFRWMAAEGKTKADELCTATPSEMPDPSWGAFKLELGIEYAKTFWNSKAPTKDTRLYKIFLHCIGHAMGFADTPENPLDVMNPAVSDSANIGAFHARVRDANAPPP